MKILAIARKEFADVMREKSLVVAFMVQLFLAGFSTLLLTGLTALYSPEAVERAPPVDIAYVGTGGLDAYLDDADNLDVMALPMDEALTAFRAGDVFAIVQETAIDPDGLRTINLLLPDGELESTLIVTQLKGILLDYEADLREQRSERLDTTLLHLERDIRPDRPYGFVYGTLLPLLVITPVFLSGAIAGDALSQEAKSKTLVLLRSAPVGPLTLVIGKLAVPVLLVPLQVLLWLGLFALNGFASAQIGLILAAATAMGLFLTATGLAVAALVRDESSTQAVYAVVVLLIAVAAMLLPRDPLNLLALLATGSFDASVGLTLAIIGAAAAIATVAAVLWTRRQIAHDLL